MVNRAFLVAGLVATVAGVAACDRVQLLAPTNSSLTVQAAAVVLSAGGSTEVTAMVLESAGTPVQNGTTVRFTTTLGRVDPVEAQTRNGIAATTFYAGEASGVADIRATSGAAGAGSSSGSGSGTGTGTNGSTTTASSVVQISVGAAAVDSITVQANPAFVSFNGGTVDVVATVLGTGGRTLPGVLVTFTTTAGTLNPISATTDAQGQAHSRLTTNAAAAVKASAGGKTSTTDAAVAVLPSPGVTLTCAIGTTTNCFSALVGQPVAFTAARASTTSTIRSARLEFGDGTGSVDLGNLTSSTTIPHVYNQPGDYNARLTVTDINNETIVVSAFVHVIEAATGFLTAEITSGRTVRATATVTGGTVLTYEWTFEGATPQMVTSTNEVTYTYATPITPTLRTISVKATLADGRTVTATTFLTVPAAP